MLHLKVSMRELWKNGILLRVHVIMGLCSFLGISLISCIAKQPLLDNASTGTSATPDAAAQNLVMTAEDQFLQNGYLEQAGIITLEEDDPQKAIELFKKAASSGKLSQQGYLKFGDAYAAVGNHYTAIQIWEVAISLGTPVGDILPRYAVAYQELGDYPALVEILKALVKIYSTDPQLTSSFPYPPSSISGLNYEIGLHLAAHDPVSAAPYLLQAAELDPDLTAAKELAFTIQRALPYENPTYTLMAVGQNLGALGMWELAAHAFRQVIEVQPDYAEAWAYLGEALQHLEDPYLGECITALETALSIDPLSLPANTFMALYWGRNGNFELSYQYLAAASEIDPGNPDVLVDLGAAAAVLGDLETAENKYRKAIEITHQDPETLREYVEFCVRYNIDLGGTAIQEARKALSSDPNNPASLDVMGQVLFRLGDLFNAERFFQRAVLVDPGYAPAYLHLGLIYSLQEKPVQAKDAYNLTISLAPGTPAALLAEKHLSNSDIP
jgi:tetratricopeptide (TPR) repeat protein